jgi:hypothetical protein
MHGAALFYASRSCVGSSPEIDRVIIDTAMLDRSYSLGTAPRRQDEPFKPSDLTRDRFA